MAKIECMLPSRGLPKNSSDIVAGGRCFPSLSYPQLSPMHSFPLLDDVGTLDTHIIRLIATLCIWSTKGRRWLILGEVDLEKNVEMSLASHCLSVLGKVGDWDLHASDSYIEDCSLSLSVD